MKKVKNRDIAIKTWLGGVCCVPNAWRRIDITMIILVKLVIPRTKEGKTVNAVINNKICSGNEYSVVSPLVDTFNAGNPEAMGSPIACTGNPLIKIKNIKLGMLYDSKIMKVVINTLNNYKNLQIVSDPVMISKSGDHLLKESAINFYKKYFLKGFILTPL